MSFLPVVWGLLCLGCIFSEGRAKEEQKMKTIEVKQELTYWQWVFLQSKVNGASYNGEALPGQVWAWPKDTYLQRRLRGPSTRNRESSN
jgi:hypothetical protein